MQLPCLTFLLGSQVLPSFHSIQNSLLLFRWPPAEILQPLHISLLLLRWKPLKIWIASQRAPLLLWRRIFVLTQPLPGMVSLILGLWLT
jgi:hypothetical protein